MMASYRWAWCVALAMMLSGAARGQEWPRFRGINGSGVNTAATLPTQWTAADIRWKVKLPGGGQGSPVVWGERVFVLSGNEETGERIASCFETRTGAKLWEHRFEAEAHRKHRFNTYASSTAAADERAVYFAWGTPSQITLAAFDHGGKALWQTQLGPYRSGHGFGSSPIVFEETVILTNEQEQGQSTLIAVDRRTGKKRWEVARETNRGTYSTPCVFAGPGGEPQLILTNWELGVTAIDPRTGRTLWEKRDAFGEKEERAIASPIVAGDLVIGACGFANRPRNLIALRPGVAKDGGNEAVWKITDSLVPHIPTALALGDRLYLWGDDGVISILDVRSGEMLASGRLDAPPGRYFASPVSDGKHIFGVSEYGRVVVLAASDRIEQVGSYDMDEQIRSSPAIANGDLLLRTSEHLWCIAGR